MGENLPKIPIEIQLYILEFIPCHEMQNVKLVSKSFNVTCSAIQNENYDDLIINIQMVRSSKKYFDYIYLKTTLSAR
jgi:hypothetical protein